MPKSSQVFDNEVRVDPRGGVGGGSATVGTRAIGASGSIVIPIISFSASVSQNDNFVIHVPMDLDPSRPVRMRMMWIPGASWSTGNYLWKLDYIVKHETAAVNTGDPTTLTINVTPANATTMREDEWTTNIYVNLFEAIYCRLWRDVANDNGDDVGQVSYLELYYKAFRSGTRIHPGQKPW